MRRTPSLEVRHTLSLPCTSSGLKLRWWIPELGITFGLSGEPQEPAAVQTNACAFGYIVTLTVTEVADWTSNRAAGRTKADTLRVALFWPLAKICVAIISEIRNAFISRSSFEPEQYPPWRAIERDQVRLVRQQNCTSTRPELVPPRRESSRRSEGTERESVQRRYAPGRRTHMSATDVLQRIGETLGSTANVKSVNQFKPTARPWCRWPRSRMDLAEASVWSNNTSASQSRFRRGRSRSRALP